MSLKGQLLRHRSEVQGKTTTFYPPEGPRAGCLPEKTFTPLQLLSGRENVPLSQRVLGGQTSKRAE